MTTEAGYRVRVTAKHIRDGIAGDCLRCAVALALDDATDDKECMVAEIDWVLRIRVWSRWIVVPPEVRQFIYEYDGLDRTDGGRPQLPRKLTGTDVAPFEFTLPPQSHPDWEEQCYRCEELFDPKELDDEGYCPDCRGEDEADED